MAHIPVLLKEIIKYSDPRPGENFIDGTCGGGGHTVEILPRIGKEGKILCLDLDEDALVRASQNIAAQNKDLSERVFFANDNFANLEAVVSKNNFSPVNVILVDLGMSSDQLEESSRGFSFLKDEPLDMRFSIKQELTAGEIVNQWPQDELEKIFREYGEEKFARRISQQIVSARKLKPILTTGRLVLEIVQAVPKRFQYGRIHFATRSFQALRIAVNDELGNLEKFLPQAINILADGGRLVLISFHSLEDRIVKNFFRTQAKEGKLRILTKKPITPSTEEIQTNPRSRSAKLRAALKLS